MGNLCSSSDSASQSPAPKSKSDAKKPTAERSAADEHKKVLVKSEKPAMWWQNPPALPPGFEDRIVAQSREASDYAAEGLSGEVWIRNAGQVRDQRINIDQCTNCTFYIVDQLDSFQVDECKDCVFFIGPTMGSVFVRNCVDCKFVVACGQLRTRDLKRCSFALFCQSRPVIESSKDIRIGCYPTSGLFHYFAFATQLGKARLSPFNNLYSQIHDFTPSASSLNYTLLDQSVVEATDFLPPLHQIAPAIVSASEAQAYSLSECVIPFTFGISRADDAPPMRTVLIFAVSKGGRRAAEQAVRSIELLRRRCDAEENQEVEINDIAVDAESDHPARDAAGDAAPRNPEVQRGKDWSRVVLISTLEHLFTADDVAQLRSAGIASVLKQPDVVGQLVGDIGIALFIATETAGHAAIEQVLRGASMAELPVRIVDVEERVDGSSSNVLTAVTEHLFAKVPTQGTGFGSGHR
jgi:hypothetical protein